MANYGCTNEWKKTPHPPKEDLDRLYFQEFKTQSEIGRIYKVTQKIVFRWFRDLDIKSRKPFKRFQRGESNSSWKGNDVTYAAFHCRVVSLKGRPNKCEVCGTETAKRYDWACIGDYRKVEDYQRMCRSCHWKHDKIANNFPNQGRPRSSASKQIKKYATP
jgi:hypothetical protein